MASDFLSIENIEADVESAIESTIMLAFMPKKIAREVRAALRHVGYRVESRKNYNEEEYRVIPPNMNSSKPKLAIGKGT